MALAFRRVIALIAQCCLLAHLASCTSTRSVPVGPDLTRQEPRVNKTPGLSVTGYVTSDGVLHPFVGTVTMEADTLVFHPVTQTDLGTYPALPAIAYGVPIRLSREEVSTLTRSEANVSRIVLVTAGVLALIVVLVVINEDEMMKFQ